MRIKKGDAYLISSALIFAAYVVAVFVTRSTVFYDATMTALVSIAAMFIVGNVADNGVKGKYYQEGLKN